MNEITSSSKPFIDQIPKADRIAIEQLRQRGATVEIKWTSEGWRYDINLQEKLKP